MLTYLDTTIMMFMIQQFLVTICHMMEVNYVHKWWDSYVFQGSYVISILEHVGEPWGTLREHCEHFETLGKCYEHVFLEQMFFHIFVSSLCIQNDILHWNRPFSWKTLTICQNVILPRLWHSHSMTLSYTTKRVLTKRESNICNVYTSLGVN